MCFSPVHAEQIMSDVLINLLLDIKRQVMCIGGKKVSFSWTHYLKTNEINTLSL